MSLDCDDYTQDGTEEEDGDGMDDDSLSDWNLSKSLCYMCIYQKHNQKITKLLASSVQ